MPHMYILECSDKSLYVGSTINIDRRLWEHQNGLGAVYTKRRRPVKLVFSNEFERIDEAFAAEKKVQNWSRKKRLALINQDWCELQEFAKCRNNSNSENKNKDD